MRFLEKTRESMLADIADPSVKKKAKLLADDAIACGDCFALRILSLELKMSTSPI